jgi:hypothetical protein
MGGAIVLLLYSPCENAIKAGSPLGRLDAESHARVKPMVETEVRKSTFGDCI